jgi:hypothetical protein
MRDSQGTRTAAKVAGATMMGLGIVAALLAFVNLYNIDEQPRWILAVVALSGGLLFAAGARLSYRQRRVPSDRNVGEHA